MTRLRVPAAALRVGDILVPTGRAVLSYPEAGVRTPRGKVELHLARRDGTPEAGHRCFNARTVITVNRPEDGAIPQSEDAGSSPQSSDQRANPSD